MSKLTLSNLATIDFSAFREDAGVIVGEKPTEAQLQVARDIDKANSEFGFLCLKNFGIGLEQANECFDGAKELFALPKEVKEKKLHQISSNDEGYVSPARREVRSTVFTQVEKEAFKIGEASTTDYSYCPPRFVESAKKLYEDIQDLKKRYIMAVALALGVNPDLLLQIANSTVYDKIRFNRYPPNYDFDGSAPATRLGAHADFGLNTFLLLKGSPCGLQIQPRSKRQTLEWTTVVIPEDVHCVVNIGELTEIISGGRWKATRHRVILSTVEQARMDRYSIACFTNPSPEAIIRPLTKEAAKAEMSKSITAEEHIERLLIALHNDDYVMETKEDE